MQATSDIDYKVLYEQSQAEVAALKLLTVELQRQLAQLQKMIFGTKHERFVPADPSSPVQQGALGLEAEAVAATSLVKAQKISYTRTTTQTKDAPITHPGRLRWFRFAGQFIPLVNE